jgi:hypothetical protein
VPEDGVRYQVGVHYYDDWGYGDSVATDARLHRWRAARHVERVRMTMDDMWDSHYHRLAQRRRDAHRRQRRASRPNYYY